MLIKRMGHCTEIVANDGCRLRELLHPDRDPADATYSVALAWVDPGRRTLPHRLRNQTEVNLLLRGTGRMHIGEESADVAEGDLVVIPRGATQWIENTCEETGLTPIFVPTFKWDIRCRGAMSEAGAA